MVAVTVVNACYVIQLLYYYRYLWEAMLLGTSVLNYVFSAVISYFSVDNNIYIYVHVEA